MPHMIRHHLIMVTQIATIVAEIAEQEAGKEGGAKDVVEVVKAGIPLIPSLPLDQIDCED